MKDRFQNSLKRLRQRFGLTQQELAGQLGISRQSLVALERGKSLPSFPLIILLEDFFNQPIRNIFKSNNQKGGRVKKHWSPFEEIDRVHQELDRAFGQSFGQSLDSVFPKINLYTSKNQVVVEAEVPGMTEKDLEINVGPDSVRIAGEKKESQEIKKKDYYRRESNYGRFDRTVSLPVKVEQAKARAEMRDGKLRVTIPAVEGAQEKIKKLKISREE